MSLSSLIVQREVATIRQVEEALARQVLYGGDLVTNLLEVAQLDESVLVPLLAESLGMPFAPLGELPVPSEDAKALVASDLASRRALMPLRVEGGKLAVAVAEPLAPEALEELSFALGMQVEQHVAPMVRIRQALAAVYGAPLERRMQRLISRLAGIDAVDPGSLPPLLHNAPAVSGAPRPASNPAPAPRHQTPALGSMDFRPYHPHQTQGGFPGPPPAPLDEQTERTPPVVPKLDQADAPQEGRARRTTDPVPALAPADAAPATPADPAPPTPASAGSLGKNTLVSIAQRASQAPPRLRRRRGPLTLDRAKVALEEAEDRDALLDLFFDFARQFFEYSALFIVHGDIAEGRDAYGPGASRERVVGIGVPLDLPSAFATARDQRVPVIVEPETAGLDPVLIADLGRSVGTPVLVSPIVVRGRSVALLIGDNGDAGVDGVAHGEVTAFASLVGQAFERIIVRRKLSGFVASDKAAIARVDVQRVLKKPSKHPQPDRAVAASALDRVVRGEAASQPPPARVDAQAEPPTPRSPSAPPVDEPAALRDHPTHPEMAAFPLPPTAELVDADGWPQTNELSEKPPPPQVARVRPMSGPPIPREEPALTLDLTPDLPAVASANGPSVIVADALDDAEERRLLDELAAEAPHSDPYAVAAAYSGDGSPPSSQAIVVPPHLPYASRSSLQSLPSVIVDVSHEFAALADRLVRNGKDEHAEAELLRQGQHAMPAIMARFPGPITMEKARVDDSPMPRVSEFGPILKLIAGQRRVALPFVLPYVDDPDAEKAFWATYLLTELAYAEAVPAVVARLFDDSEQTRRVARAAAKAVAEVAREALVQELDRIVRDSEASPSKRIATIDTLGEMRDSLVVPVLIGALSDEDDEVALAARRALMAVSRQDFGRDTRRWLAWWGTNSSRHRIEWLIDALTHDVPAMRRAAGQELKTITKEYFGYYDDLPRRERERAQQRYRDWWRTEGRARFRKALG